MDITEVAQRSGVPASTLRFYEEKGLIASIGRRGLRRVFDTGVIALGRAAGFSLDEIARMFAPDGRPHRPADAHSQSGGTGPDYSQTSRHAGQTAACRCVPRAEPHGMSHVPPHSAGRRVWSYWSAQEKSFAVHKLCACQRDQMTGLLMA